MNSCFLQFHRLAAHLRYLAGLVLCLGLAGCMPTGTTHKVTREVGYKGIARTEPYLAAQRMLNELEWEAKTIHSISELPHGGTLVLGGDGSMSQTVGVQALDWVKRNDGHLILILRGTEPWRDDWSTNFGDVFSNAKEYQVHPILQKLGIKVTQNRSTVLSKSGEDFSVKIRKQNFDCASRYFVEMDASSQNGRLTVVEGKPEESQLVSLPWQGGRITILGDGSLFRNRFIDEKDHAKLLVALLDLGLETSYQREICFLFSGNETFFGLLWKKYWMALIALGFLIAFWMWKNLPRFGPLIAESSTGIRQFSGHLKMTGTYLWRRRQSADLLLPLRRAIEHKLALRHPASIEHDEGRLMERLAASSGLPYERVARAWSAGFVKDGHSMLNIIRDLQIIEQSL